MTDIAAFTDELRSAARAGRSGRTSKLLAQRPDGWSAAGLGLDPTELAGGLSGHTLAALLEAGLPISDPDALLHHALLHDLPEPARRAVRSGADPNRTDDIRRQTPLHRLLMLRGRKLRPGSSALLLFEELLAAGADPNAGSRDQDQTMDCRPLHAVMIYSDRPALVDLLVDRGADPDLPDEAGVTPLEMAASEPMPKMARRLLARGADPNARDKHGITPLHRAMFLAGIGDLDAPLSRAASDVVHALLRAGADIRVCDARGRTPLDMIGDHLSAQERLDLLRSAHNRP